MVRLRVSLRVDIVLGLYIGLSGMHTGGTLNV